MKTLIVGDIHGCYDQLVRLLNKLDFRENEDRLISLGDLMDRGTQSYEVLMYLRGLKGRMKEIIAEPGNPGYVKRNDTV